MIYLFGTLPLEGTIHSLFQCNRTKSGCSISLKSKAEDQPAQSILSLGLYWQEQWLSMLSWEEMNVERKVVVFLTT
jgi:hypothetical protein